jgi:hypothetical protein
MEENLEVGGLFTTTAASITLSGMLSLVLVGVPLDVDVVFAAVVVVVCDEGKGTKDLVPGTCTMPLGAGAAETSAPRARRLRMLTK